MKHAFVSTQPAASDSTLVDSTKWNALHLVGLTPLAADTVLDTTYDGIKATGGVGGITLTLPTAVGNGGLAMKIMKVDSGAGAVTVATAIAQTINSDSTYVLSNQWQYVEVISDGSNWIVWDSN